MSRINRRTFLAASATTAAAWALGSCKNRHQSAGSRGRVIVVGAGLSGLAAARILEGAGFEVRVIEARSRPGGRVKTVRDSLGQGLHYEAGAMWVPSTHRVLRRYLARHDIALAPAPHPNDARDLAFRYFVRDTTIDVRNDGMVCTKNGKNAPFPMRLDPEEAGLGLGRMRRRYIGRPAEGIGDPRAADWPPSEAWRFDDITFARFLRNQGASAEALAWMRMGLYDDWGDGADAVSALCVLRDQAQLGEGATSDVAVNGLDRLPRSMADDLRRPVEYGRPCRRIEQSEGGVRVTVGTPAGPAAIDGDRVVLTVPFSVIRESIEFSPDLSEGKRNAIRELPYTSVVKVHLGMKDRYWRKLGCYGDSIGDLAIQAIIHATVGQPGPRGILASYTAAKPARALASRPERDRVDFVLGQMERVFPGARSRFSGGESVVWDDEPWSRGAFVWFRPGQMRRHLRHVRKPEGRIHFAGEHTSPCPGWMEGALISGERVAKEIIDNVGETG